jgi:hypothetical protein
MRGGSVRNAGRRPGDLLWAVEAQRAAVIADLADVRTGQGEAHVPGPPCVLALVRVGGVGAAFGVVRPSPQSHDHLRYP